MKKCCKKMKLILSKKDKYWDREIYCKYCSASHWLTWL